MGQLLALFFSISYGLSNVFTSKAMEHGDIDRFTGLYITVLINTIINALVIIVYLSFVNSIEINLKGIMFFGIAGLLNSFLARGVFFAAIPYIGVSRSGAFKVISPVFAILGGVLILGEVLSTNAWIGALVVIFGVTFLSFETLRQSYKGNSSYLDVAGSIISVPKKGILLALMSGFFLGIGNVFRKLGVGCIPSSIVGVFIGSVVSLVSVAVFQVMKGKAKELVYATKHMNRDYFLSGLFSSVALYSVFMALKYIPVSYSNSIGASESLFTMLWSLIICGKKELLTIRTFIGTVIVVAGISLLMLF
ncbi:MAG: DMT family transporter [Clostridiales bacterium]|nr:DMT family transporter [Clostridiales bacterium]